MITSDIVQQFRYEMADNVTPYLWTDEELYPFLDEAQTRFCRETDGLTDSRTASVTQLSVVPNTEWYPTDPSILNIRTCNRSDTGRPVKILTADQALERRLLFIPTNTGLVRFLVLGFDPHYARIWPMPSETITLNLTVYRLPLITLTDVGNQTPEIDAQHHTYLLLWMKHRAYNKQDTETFDRIKSTEFRDEFFAYCEKARKEQGRARRAMGNVAYGGPHIGAGHQGHGRGYSGYINGSINDMNDYGQ